MKYESNSLIESCVEENNNDCLHGECNSPYIIAYSAIALSGGIIGLFIGWLIWSP